jgi:uncharacterized phage protein gp47/JayE
MGPESEPISPVDEVVSLVDIPIGPEGTTARNVYRRDTEDADFYLLVTLNNNTSTTFTDSNESALADPTPVGPADNTTDRVDIGCQSLEPGTDFNVGVEEIDQLIDSIDGVDGVSNAAAFTGGSDDEDDDEYRARLVLALSADVGQGNKSDYIRWAQSVDGVSGASVIPQWAGSNTVKVVLVGPDNTAVSSQIVASVQNLLDPESNGYGEGLAPIGAVVTVDTVTAVEIAVSATIVHTDPLKYSLDGEGGTSATRLEIVNAIESYLRSLPPGSDVVWTEVLSRIVTVDGIYDVESLTLNEGASNVTIGATEVPVLTSYTLSSGDGLLGGLGGE